MKIIDADKLHYKQVYIHTEKGLRPALVVFAKEIRKMPEIVRCKDCLHWKKSGIENLNYCDAFDWKSKGEDYCSFAERREDVQESD